MLSDQTRDGLFVSCLLYVCDVCGQCACDVCVVENAHAMLLLIENGSKAVRVDFKLEIQGQQIPLLFSLQRHENDVKSKYGSNTVRVNFHSQI